MTATVLLAEDSLPGHSYQEIGPIEVSVKKLTVFHKDPTKEQAQEALRVRARTMGADAVINVTYASGVGFTTWGYMDAKGVAVKLQE
ncbi:MAG TPA: heavy metal-binding domain-containing protein [Gammaproteobacteria bacterium]|nr:heavy metal-binding domain-containing protein [Gammaproteobacteria bacterium]